MGLEGVTTRTTDATRRKLFPWIVTAAVIVGLLAGGVTVRLLRHKLLAKEPAAEAANDAAKHENPEAPIVSADERFALEASHQYADPDTADHRVLKKGLDFQVDLLVYYLKRHRLKDAETFCQELLDRKYKQMPKGGEHPYLVFARLGQSLVSAFNDDPKSLDRLGGMINFKPGQPSAGVPANLSIGGIPGNMFDSPDLRHLIVEALNRLAIDLHVEQFAKYPQLDDLRRSMTPFRGTAKNKT
jgi:hypothetical protein